ncbi:0ddfb5fb-ad17-4faf-b27b-9d6a588b07a4 [Sclerotinia trifoliorum]|uniref:0ddfb5fb-ad17-4faf-b27b-9d6a588b07a4 n=1 Tax=Sclerotinia trifoliorum TaxID=28548 RepID=A0A8H2VTH4_9HELO|nr:0ddfb5fb-ad17-4faf-b27b-9d6a588b07a4 [Sclerotinia trifoliorum]
MCLYVYIYPSIYSPVIIPRQLAHTGFNTYCEQILVGYLGILVPDSLYMQPNSCSIRKIRDDMTTSGEKGDSSSLMAPINQSQSLKSDNLPPELMDIIKPALQFGGLSALSGTIVGGFSGILVSRTPVLFAVASSIQWGIIGTTFWGTRTALLSHYRTARIYPTPQEKALSTTLAASLAGATGGILRGPKNVLPGFVVFASAGYVGQRIYDALDEKKMEEMRFEESGKKGNGETWINSRWVPWKKLTDDEYEGMLKERLLKVDAEIAILDDKLQVLREQQINEAGRPEVTGRKDL